MSGCDYAACREPATTRAGGWAFCPKHAEDDRKIRAGQDDALDGEPLTPDLLPPAAEGHGTEWRARQHQRDGEQPCPPCAAAAARASQDRDRKKQTMTIPQPSPLARLLEEASGHGSPKVRKLGERIEALFDDLRTLIVAEQAREEARQEVERLEQELAEARARLKGGEPDAARRPGRPAAEGDGRTVELQCRKGCGKTVRGAQGRAAHERNCAHEPPASAESAA